MHKDHIQLERERLIQEWIPSIFSSNLKSVLYVGANKRRQHFVDMFESSGYTKITILEIFLANIEFLKTKFQDRDIYSIVHGDVRNVDDFNFDKFDVVFYWHGIDLLPQNDIETTLKKLERLGKSLVVLGTPYGKFPKDDTVFDYNQNEDHVSPIYPPVLERFGYETRTQGPKDQIGSSITAWKIMS